MTSTLQHSISRSGYDAVVVGARCAGAATGMLLARAGLRVAVVDRASAGTDTLSTHALMRAGVLQLHRWGLLHRVIAAGTLPIRRTAFRYGDASTTVDVRPMAGFDALYAPRRTVLDPILVEAAAEAGADMLFGVSVTGLEHAEDGRVTGVVGHDEQRRPVRLRARLTIGADGMRSTVARAVDAPVEVQGQSASSFIYAHVGGMDLDGYEWFYAPRVAAAVIPTNHGEACVSVGAPRERFRAELAADVPAAFRRLLTETSPELAARVAQAAAPAQLRSFPGVPGFLRRPWGPGWALVGDAGYFKDPSTAHGISDALRDAELLARAVVGSAGGHVTEAAALEEYHRLRDRLSLPLFTVTETLASYEWGMDSIETHLRAFSKTMAEEVDYLMALGDLGDVAEERLAG